MGLLNASQRYYYEGADGVQNSGDENYGGYQFTSLADIINQFIIAYIGEGKIISKARRTDVTFHAMRALQEFSFDTFKSTKAFEYTVPPSLKMPLPQDYVNYVKLAWIDNAGVRHVIYPASKSSNPSAYQQNADGSFKLETNSYIRKTGQATFSSTGQPIIAASTEYTEYGITKTGKTTNKNGTGDVKSNKLLPKFKKETRVTVTGASRVLSNGSNSTHQLAYGPGSEMQMNFFASQDIVVGMTVFGPGIPDNTTVASVRASFSPTNYPGMGITFTNPAYEQWLLDGSTGTNPGRPTDTQIAGEEVIFVDLNKQSDSASRYSSYNSTSNSVDYVDDYETDLYWPNEGKRYGLDPSMSQVNGTYYIDHASGCIYFSSNIAGRIIVLDYVSDSLGTDEEMIVHKFAEEAMYKCIAHAILATRANTPEYLVNRFKKEKFAAKRVAKLRLSNLKIEELSQILRGKSKQIKH